jgi:predicted ribosome quality control (RQC) complex YloA/Tae2 family protein
MQTALHITSLVTELTGTVVGGKITATEFYKKERAAYIFVKREKKPVALGFVYHPINPGFFLVPASKVRPETREKPWPIFGLTGATITGAEQVGFDRLIRINLEQDNDTKSIILEAIGPNGNIWLLDSSGNRQSTLRKRQFNPGEPYQTPAVSDRLNPLELTSEQLQEKLKASGNSSPGNLIERQVLGFNRTMSRELLHRADLDFADTDILDQDGFEALTVAIREMAERFISPEFGYLYTIRTNVEAYPFKLSMIDEVPEKFKSLSLAVQEMTHRRQTTAQSVSEEKRIVELVQRGVKRLKRRLGKLEDDIGQAADYERYKKIGELLQIHHQHLKKGMKSIQLDDLYDAGQTPIEVELDPALSPAENIEKYFRKYRKGREGLSLLKRRQEISREELESLKEILARLQSNFQAASEQFASEIKSLLPRETSSGESAPRLPYRECQLSSGLTVFIGRDGVDNDRTTFEYARPWELWFHAQQCPGSHVVMKFPNKSFEPTSAEIEETAAIAAYHSKARSDSLVPVIYAQRKHVRKPRKAKPGLVTVEREKSILVVPRSQESVSTR